MPSLMFIGIRKDIRIRAVFPWHHDSSETEMLFIHVSDDDASSYT